MGVDLSFHRLELYGIFFGIRGLNEWICVSQSSVSPIQFWFMKLCADECTTTNCNWLIESHIECIEIAWQWLDRLLIWHTFAMYCVGMDTPELSLRWHFNTSQPTSANPSEVLRSKNLLCFSELVYCYALRAIEWQSYSREPNISGQPFAGTTNFRFTQKMRMLFVQLFWILFLKCVPMRGAGKSARKF